MKQENMSEREGNRKILAGGKETFKYEQEESKHRKI